MVEGAGVADGAVWVRLAITVAADWVLIALNVGWRSIVGAWVGARVGAFVGAVVGAAVGAVVGAAVGVAVAVGLPHPTNNPAKVNTTISLHASCMIFITVLLFVNNKVSLQISYCPVL